jgi:hypothetical protein
MFGTVDVNSQRIITIMYISWPLKILASDWLLVFISSTPRAFCKLSGKSHLALDKTQGQSALFWH